MSRKKILIITQGISQYYYDCLRGAFNLEDKVDIITSSDITAESVIKCHSYNAKSIKSRIKSWLQQYSFIMKWYRGNRDKKYDLIYCTSNPPINAYIGIKLKKKYGAKFVYMYWDLYPQAIETLMADTIVRNVVVKLWNLWNEWNFKKIDQILSIGDVIKESIQERISYPLNTKVMPIHANIDLIKPIAKEDNIFLKKNNLSEKFIILYSGKMGRGHNIELILEAAHRLEGINDMMFVFIGDGEKRHLVEEYIEKEYKNVAWFPLQPMDKFPYSIACGDIGIVSQEQKAAKYFLPSKTFSMMAAGEAIIGICSDHDDLQQLIDNNRVGYAIKDNRSESLCDAIMNLYQDRDELEKLKQRAISVAIEKCNKKRMIAEYRRVFNDILAAE